MARLFDAYRQFYHEKSDLPAARKFLRDRLTRKESVVFLARRRGECVGFAQLYPAFSSTRLGRLWILNDLFVDPKARKQGVGSRLLQRCQELAEESGALGVWLETAVNNPAQRLYAAHGWKLDREFLHYDWDPGVIRLRHRPASSERSARSTRSRGGRRRGGDQAPSTDPGS